MTSVHTLSPVEPSVAIAEQPLLFGRSRSLVGMACVPAGATDTTALPALVFLNSGILHRVGPNRLYVHAARRLARMGYASLRFDLGGIGDSSTAPDETGSILEIVSRDIDDAITAASKLTCNGSVILIGLCSGADNALHAAVRDPRVGGAVLIDMSIHQPWTFYAYHYARRLLDPRRLAKLLSPRHPIYRRLAMRLRGVGSSDGADEPVFLAPIDLMPLPEMHAQLRGVLDRGARLQFLFSGGLEDQYNHRNQFFHVFPDLRRDDRLAFRYFGDADHTFSHPDLQRRLIDEIVQWLTKVFGMADRTAPRDVA